jgi:hypothetical protein
MWVLFEILPMAFLSRFNKRNILLVGLWFHRSKPPMATFLRPIIEEMNRLADRGKVCEAYSMAAAFRREGKWTLSRDL